MAITITAKERDALYEEILIRMSGIDAVYLAARAGDSQKAEELGREFADNLLLVLNDLGWGDSPDRGAAFELTTSPDVLRRSLNRLLGSAADQLALEERERDREVRTYGAQNQFVIDTCVDVLKALDGVGQ